MGSRVWTEQAPEFGGALGVQRFCLGFFLTLVKPLVEKLN